MNANCYKIVFSKRLGALVAVGEHASSSGKKASGQATRTTLAAAAFTLVMMGHAHGQSAISTTALPTAGTVSTGAATITSAGARMDISQTSNKASINWNSFNIGSTAAVNIAQPNANAVLLNRVTGNDPSQIFGKLSANGQVILLNPNGIVFGKNGSVTASSFTASTFGLSDADFKNDIYKYERQGSVASVINQGSIQTSSGGFVALIGATVINEGRINSQQGDVVLAAAESVTIPSTISSASNTLSLPLTRKVRLEIAPASINTSIQNTSSGVIVTEGGKVLMQAAAISDAVANITHNGSIDTTAVQGGSVSILAEAGIIKVDGNIKANSTAIDSQGKTLNGGSIIIGRDEDTGALAKSTDVSRSKLESLKGFIETSAHNLTVNNAEVKASEWLLDPDNIDITGDSTTVTAGYSKIKASDIAASLNAGTSVTVSTTAASRLNQPVYNPSAVTGDGNIVVNAAIDKTGTSDANLTLLADNGITVNAGARIGIANGSNHSGKLNVTMEAKGNASSATNSRGIYLYDVIDANGGVVTLTGTNKNTTIQTHGVKFGNGSGINAESYTVNGYSTAGSTTVSEINGVYFTGTTNFNSTGTSLINGVSNDQSGSFTMGTWIDGTATTFNAGTTGKVVVKGSNPNWHTGLRIGNGATSTNSSPTVTTNGDVTFGALEDSSNFIFRNGTIIANSGTLSIKGQGGSTALSLYDAFTVTGNNGASINIEGVMTSSTGNAVFIGQTAAAIVRTNGGGNITIKGTSEGGVGVGLGLINAHSAIINSSGAVKITGVSRGNVTSSQYPSKGVISIANITGTSVTIDGTSTNNEGTYIAGNITATTGNIDITGITSAATFGVELATATLSTSASNKKINITTDNLSIGSSSSINAGTTGTVTLQTATDSVGIDLSNTDTTSSTATSRKMGLSQTELNTITANNLEIGSVTTGDITVVGNTTTKTSTGHLKLITGSNIAVNATLNVGDDASTAGTVEAYKYLTLNATGSGSQITDGTSGIIKTLGLELQGTNAIYTLDNGTHNITTLAGNTKTVTLTNNTAFDIGSVYTAGLTTSGATSLSSTASVTQTQKIQANGLVLLGTGGRYTLNNTSNNVGTIAANTGSLNFTNAATLSVGSVNSTNGITGTGTLSLNTQSGDLNVTNNITTQGIVNLNANAAISSNTGIITADTLNLIAGSTIGTAANRMHTEVANMSLSSGGDQFVTEATTVRVAARTTANNGSIDIATTNGNLSVSGAAINGLTGITANGYGNVSLTGNTTAGTGLYIGNDIISTSGNISLKGTTTTNTSNTDSGVNIAAGVSGQNISMTATATSTTGNVRGYYGANGRFVAAGSIELTASSNNNGSGFYTFNGNFNSGTGITIRGTSALGQGVGLDNGITLINGNTAGGITIIGTANSANQQAISLRSVSITNGFGDTTLKANSGDIFTGNNIWGGTPTSNSITNNSSGIVQLSAGNGSSTNAGAIDATALTITQNGNAGVLVQSSGTGNVTAPKIINTGSGDVVVSAGSALLAGDGTGGQVLTVSGNSITESGSGKTYIYTGSPSTTGTLSALSSDFSDLYYQGTSHTINTGFNKAFDNLHSDDLMPPTGGSLSNAQVLFRSATAPSFTMVLNDLIKHYGDSEPTLVSAYTGGSSLNTTVGNNTFKVSAAEVLANLTGTTRQSGDSAGTYYYSNLSAAGYNTTLATTNSSLKLTIGKRDITLSSLTAASREYDGTTTANITGATFNNLVAGETLTLTGAGTFSDANYGLGKSVTTDITQLSKNGSLSAWNNYNLLDTSYTTTANITKAPLTIKVNDTAIFVTQDASTAINQLYSYTGFKNGETASTALTGGALTAANRSYSDPLGTTVANRPSAGFYANVYGLNNTPTALNDNYAITVQKGNLTVTPADKLLITIASQSDTYGSRTTTNAGLTSGATVSAQYCLISSNCNGSNLVNLTMTQLGGTQWKATDVTGSYVVFDTALQTQSYSTGGYLNAGNYTYGTTQITPLSLPHGNFTGRETNGGVLTITPIAATLSPNSASRVYDGTNNLTGTTLSLSNIQTGDAVVGAVGAGTLASKDVGNNQTANYTHISLAGADASNYYLTSTTLTGTASITPKPLTLIGVNAANKVFDGNTLATLTSNGSLYGLVGLETLSISDLSGVFDTPAIGANKTVRLSATLGNGSYGGLASNYSLQASTTTADITSSTNSSATHEPITYPTQPALPSNNNTTKSRVSSSLGSNPYLSLPQPRADNTERCNLNTASTPHTLAVLDDCLCETRDVQSIEGLAICYEPKQTVQNRSTSKRRI